MESKQTLKLNDICLRYGISRTTLWHLRQSPGFPKPVNLPYGGKIFFQEDIENYFRTQQG
ncbi:AlpA family transcriptional regulator [Endozoicomonas sp. SCSIO W0465]|uniref:helix-turn-helix transcriptional regulator n=1 Tax=Endozoicomonas sp. SCSIO W0465 TaxID=2918516 RepID=UPI002075FBBB|nr:hypothetical protein [Endozoicomonas sp. SCSIO W0465]USE36904.1 hypothetical protein MJO57_01280 [Endozoicomonas sp. SCSIO W0465]